MSNLALNSTAFDVTFGLQQLAARNVYIILRQIQFKYFPHAFHRHSSYRE